MLFLLVTHSGLLHRCSVSSSACGVPTLFWPLNLLKPFLFIIINNLFYITHAQLKSKTYSFIGRVSFNISSNACKCEYCELKYVKASLEFDAYRLV